MKTVFAFTTAPYNLCERSCGFCLLMLFSCALSVPCYGEHEDTLWSDIPDRVVLRGTTERPVMHSHNVSVITLALEKTRDKYGPYSVKSDMRRRSSKRVFLELGKPKEELNVNTHVAVSSKQRESQAHAIKLPVRMGLLNYRLIVTKKSHLAAFRKVRNVEDLKRLTVGSVDYWSVTRILQENHFKVVLGLESNAIYSMLRRDRFLYLLRGVSELYVEQRDPSFQGLEIEPSLLVYLPLPYYIFVAPAEKRLIKRIEEGMEIAIADGSFKATFLTSYSDYIERSALSKRKALYVHNEFLEGNPVLMRRELWYLHDKNFSRHLEQNFHPLRRVQAKTK